MLVCIFQNQFTQLLSPCYRCGGLGFDSQASQRLAIGAMFLWDIYSLTLTHLLLLSALHNGTPDKNSSCWIDGRVARDDLLMSVSRKRQWNCSRFRVFIPATYGGLTCMLSGHQFQDENVRVKIMKPPSNRNRTKPLKIRNSSRDFY